MMRIAGIFIFLFVSVVAHAGIPPTLANVTAYCITLISGIVIGMLFSSLKHEDQNAH